MRAWPTALAGVLMAVSAQAQSRPTLGELQSELTTLQGDHAALQAQHDALQVEHDALEVTHAALQAEHDRTNAAVCAKADADGDSYRPFVCPARCDCLDPALAAEACAEVAPGSFEITATTSAATTCLGLCIEPVSGTPTTQRCAASSECPASYGCFFEWPVINGSEIGRCGTFSACTQDSECDPGFSCGQGACVGDFCGEAGDPVCPGAGAPIVLATFMGLTSDPDAPDPVTCTDYWTGSASYSTRDSLACLAQVEATTGAPCSYLCGDGDLDAGEQCDDGNTTPGDGCDASCQLEP